jgi:hypothetical protein
MAYYVPASNCGGSSLPAYTCNDCPDKEYGRIRSVALIKSSYLMTVLAAPSTLATWQTGVSTGNIITFPKTQGSYDGGNTTEQTGFGDDATMNGNTVHTAEFFDLNYANNCDMWNVLRDSNEYTFAFVTSSKIHFATTNCTLTPKNAVADDVNSIVGWRVTAKWQSPDSPCDYTKPTGAFTNCLVYS